MLKRSFWYRLRKISPVRIIVFGFILLILLGTLLLSLPISNKGERLSVLDTMFTTTSAVCVTGLIIADTAQQWTAFGQAVILTLIQIGGLGFMAILTLFSFIARRKITLKEHVVISEALSGVDVGDSIPLMKRILLGTLLFEAVGTVLLSTVFIPEYGFGTGIWKSVFVSVSAFCNAGFDVMGDKYGAFAGLTPYVDNVIVNLTVCFLIIMGGLGFFVWGSPGKKHMPLHTKIVLTATTILILGGTVLFYVLEQHNPMTLGNMPVGDKILAAFFQSVTTRTAGFSTVPNGELMVSSKVLTILLMFIGGSPGSTAGGLKTVTAMVAVWGAISVLRGCNSVNFFKRRISKTIVLRAMSVTIIALLITGVSSFCLLYLGGGAEVDLVFEAFSAFGTVGLGTGITPALPEISKIILILLMYTGRVGIMTLAASVLFEDEKTDNLRFSEEKIMLG